MKSINVEHKQKYLCAKNLSLQNVDSSLLLCYFFFIYIDFFINCILF